MVKGFRFTNQLANAEVDARIHQEFLNKQDGIFYGMNLSNTTNSITVGEGLCEIAGRPVAVIGSETITAGTTTAYCLLVLEIDLSKESTKDTFNQANFKILSSTSGYPTVTQQDINIYNGNNNIYQLEFARFRTSSSGINSFRDTRKFLNYNGIYSQVKKDCQAVIDDIKEELNNIKNGSSYLMKDTSYVELTGAVKGSAIFDSNGKATVNTSQNNIFVINDSITLENGTGRTTINYPEGLNYSNCVPISIGAAITNGVYEYGQVYSSFIMGARLTQSNISVSAYSPQNVGPSRSVPYKLVLLKIN